ncbi:FadR family transcriptional regulator [Dietzia sp. DQ12-76]|nr:GntR family transcriptional regulator [Dietzia sp. JS16-p6b]MBB1025643.1 FadR family transcriptional regulator [Dietzia sp. DQ12-76]MBB1027967.1 FadR family transcriptional regulator [Dietzia sp. DQ11-38-2]QGW25134.1 GntR family transcriptional regulator [Dietzia sp. DQ12-45-1b]
MGRPKKTALLVAQQIVEDISRRGNTVGDRLPPEHLMLEHYGVGRGTLRESLRYLELQGVLMLKPGPGGGPIVQQPDGGTLAATLSLLLQFENAPFSTIMEARAALEPTIARLATARIDDAGLARLAENLRLTREELTDQAAFSAHSERFHELVAWSSGNALFGYLFDALSGLIAGASMGITYPRRQRELTCDIHEEIYAAISDGDGDTASHLMSAHINEHTTYLEKRFHKALARPIRWDLDG